MVYAIYDTTGIQSYIFSSSKLKENVGASILVGRVFTCFLPQVLKCHFGVGNVLTNWQSKELLDAKGWAFNKTAEIIYIGGGNAYVAYKTVNDYKTATAAFLRKVYDETATIGIASAFIETDFTDNYTNQHKSLMKLLSQAKGEVNRPIMAGNQPITRASLLTGLPVVKIDKASGNMVSVDQALKRSVNENGLDSFDSLKRGDTSFLSVVHIDGNSMGKHIEEYMINGSGNWSEAVPKIRKMSHRISKLYREALCAAKKTFESYYETSKKCALYRSKSSSIPLIEIICDGDDVTCVITGLWGISFAVQLLRNIETYGKKENLYPFIDWSQNSDKSQPHISACAGVTIFHSHYPFSAAYKMAEDCCKNAKYYTRKADKFTGNIAGSFIDFHIHYGGAVTDLSSFRENQYKDRDDNSLIHPPFCVLYPDDTEDEIFKLFEAYTSFCDFDDLLRTWAKQKGKKKWPRSRLKTLRDAISSGEEEIEKVLDWCRVRGYTLPKKYYPEIKNDAEFQEKTKVYASPNDEEKGKSLYKYALLFSALEFADIYENISEESEE